ncbi:olfactory receptor 2AK2 [Cebus imitator]|uniref:olfactory receptor 2AK2 n=1 Tax=Cebus imitator TaxID=2715852 RepID=UPI000809E44E|nr:olfactory receptor 2AK2 [Cebus imitator]
MKTGKNQSVGTDFLLVGLFQYGRINSLLFVIIATLFTVALTGNIMLIHLIRLDTRLHTPMYFLLSQLSIIDMMYICTTVPKMAVNFLSKSKTITFLGCEIQTYVFLVLGGTEALLLGFMSYDRYVAICHPLCYPILMSKKICCLMVACAWASSSVSAFMHTLYVFQLPFCRSRLIDHFFCEVPALLSLVCQDTSQYEYTILLSGFTILLATILGHSSFLRSCAYCGIPHELRKRTGKSCFHLFLPPECGKPVLCNCSLYLHEATLLAFPITGQGSGSILHHYHTSTEPIHL